MAGPSNDMKNPPQSQRGDRSTSANQELKSGTKADNIVRQERGQAKSEELRTIASVRETTRARTTRLSNRRPAGPGSGLEEGRDPKSAGRSQSQQKTQQQQREQRVEAVAFRYTVNQKLDQQQTANQQTDPRAAAQNTMQDLTPGTGREREGREAFEAPNVTGDRQADTQAAEQRFDNGPAAGTPVNQEISVDMRLGIGAEQQVVSLEALVGPEATLTFREKMHEVWGFLEQDSKAPLDVLAHAPLNVQGMNAMELLMVESPQGVHFVAFLRNGNDFDMLATFDRHALLPTNPSRQLVEAALIAFQQINTIATDAARNLADKLKELVEVDFDTGADKLGGVRAAVIRAKRVRENCREADKRLVEILDNLDKEYKRTQAEEREKRVELAGDFDNPLARKPTLERDEVEGENEEEVKL